MSMAERIKKGDYDVVYRVAGNDYPLIMLDDESFHGIKNNSKVGSMLGVPMYFRINGTGIVECWPEPSIPRSNALLQGMLLYKRRAT